MKLDTLTKTLPLFLLAVIGFALLFSILIVFSFMRPYQFTQFPLIAEIIILSVFLYLAYWYKNSSQALRNATVLPTVLGAVTSFALIYGTIVWLFIGHSMEFTNIALRAEKRFQKEASSYIPLFTTIFDKAETTNVRSDIDQQYGTRLSSTGNREPSYFVRLKGDALQKLFQSGDIKNEVVNTEGEREVVQMLEGQRKPIAFPQYTCCGGDDFFPDIPFIRLLLPDRRYLKDFPSELELILLVKDEKGSILGAKVLLHGD